MQQYHNILDTLKSYRKDLTETLKENKLFFDTDEINLSVDNHKINYHRWLHPNQGDWELEWLFNDYKLSCIKKHPQFLGGVGRGDPYGSVRM